uniref:Uncharacterized protein n=1 Tax=Prevotella sp. GTC17253 TaxID=3236793 RepID=A0AB33IP57_9BACT
METINKEKQCGSDLLTDILNVQVHNEEKITEQDRRYCREQQDELYKSLDRIDHWYGIFTEEAEQYRESHRISYKDNGEIRYRDSYPSYREVCKDYTELEFKPFKVINEMVDCNYRAVSAFANRIVSYFNRTYNVSVPSPSIDKDTLEMGFRPDYATYVDMVIEHLGGRSFRTTAEEELLIRFHRTVHKCRWSPEVPELKNCKISFPNILSFDDFYSTNYNQNRLHYNYRTDLETFCSGILFGSDDLLCGSSDMILNFNEDNIDVSSWYDLTTANAEQIRFFKNGRIDIRFKDREAAQACYGRLRLGDIKPESY